MAHERRGVGAVPLVIGMALVYTIAFVAVSSLLAQRFVYGKGILAVYTRHFNFVDYLTKDLGIGVFQLTFTPLIAFDVHPREIPHPSVCAGRVLLRG